jgi:hypothetical protein
MVNTQLLQYVREQIDNKVSPHAIKRVLLDNEWSEADINDVFAMLNVQDDAVGDPSSDKKYEDAFSKERLTLDKIIEKFVPIAGALFLIIGFGYLIYDNAWVHFTKEVRIGIGFFFSLAIIGGSFSLSEKMRYFTDIGIGSGVLLMYGTLIYGSRTTDLAADSHSRDGDTLYRGNLHPCGVVLCLKEKFTGHPDPRYDRCVCYTVCDRTKRRVGTEHFVQCVHDLLYCDQYRSLLGRTRNIGTRHDTAQHGWLVHWRVDVVETFVHRQYQ